MTSHCVFLMKLEAVAKGLLTQKHDEKKAKRQKRAEHRRNEEGQRPFNTLLIDSSDEVHDDTVMLRPEAGVHTCAFAQKLASTKAELQQKWATGTPRKAALVSPPVNVSPPTHVYEPAENQQLPKVTPSAPAPSRGSEGGMLQSLKMMKPPVWRQLPKKVSAPKLPNLAALVSATAKMAAPAPQMSGFAS